MYFSAETYEYAAANYATIMRKNVNSVVNYMNSNPEWALEVTFLFIDRMKGWSQEPYPPMRKNVK